MWKTTKEFFLAVGKWWWVVTTDLLIGSFLSIYQFIDPKFVVPSWMVPTVYGIGLLIASFAAFHKVRVDRDTLLADRNDRLKLAREAIEFGIGKLTGCRDRESTTAQEILSAIRTEAHAIADRFGSLAENEFLACGDLEQIWDQFTYLVTNPADTKALRKASLDPYIESLNKQLATLTSDKIMAAWLR